MTTQINRRLEALEAKAPSDHLQLVFVQWMPRADMPRFWVEWCGKRLEQGPDESMADFEARVEAAVELDRPKGKNAALLFFNELDVAQ